MLLVLPMIKFLEDVIKNLGDELASKASNVARAYKRLLTEGAWPVDVKWVEGVLVVRFSDGAVLNIYSRDRVKMVKKGSIIIDERIGKRFAEKVLSNMVIIPSEYPWRKPIEKLVECGLQTYILGSSVFTLLSTLDVKEVDIGIESLTRGSACLSKACKELKMGRGGYLMCTLDDGRRVRVWEVPNIEEFLNRWAKLNIDGLAIVVIPTDEAVIGVLLDVFGFWRSFKKGKAVIKPVKKLEKLDPSELREVLARAKNVSRLIGVPLSDELKTMTGLATPLVPPSEKEGKQGKEERVEARQSASTFPDYILTVSIPQSGTEQVESGPHAQDKYSITYRTEMNL